MGKCMILLSVVIADKCEDPFCHTCTYKHYIIICTYTHICNDHHIN